MRYSITRRPASVDFWKAAAGILACVLAIPSAVAAEGPPVLDAPPAATQKPYSPADGQVVEISPPPFLWTPVKHDGAYVLEVSTAENFSAETTRTYGNLRRPVFVPREVLPPGKWFWHAASRREARPSSDGRGRLPFRPPRGPFPFPTGTRSSSGFRASDRGCSFPARLEQVRRWAGGELKPAVDALVARCRREIGKPLVAEPGVRPKGPEYGPWAINVMRTTRPPMDVMERCALAYLLTGDEPLGREAKRRLEHFFAWDPEGPTSFFAYDEPPMWMMMRGTRAYDWTHDLFPAEERAEIEKNMKARAGQFLKRLEQLPFESRPYESHAGRLPGFLGECALSFIHEWPEARDWLDYATLLYYTSYPAWGGDDGGWQEGPSYWSAYMQFALHYVVALREATGVDLTAKPFFRNTPFYALYTATPYHQHRPFGDGQTGSPRGLGNVLYVFSTLLQDPHLRWYAAASQATIGADLLTLAAYDPRLKARSPLELPQSRCFPSVGLASFHAALGDKENDISFLLRSSPYGGVSHGHADQNAFVVEAFGRGLAIATGYYPWYGSPHHVEWTRATHAVNSVLVDGEGQVPRRWDANGRLTAFESSGGYDYAEGEAAPAYQGRLKRFRRHVVHARPGVFVICDDLEAPRGPPPMAAPRLPEDRRRRAGPHTADRKRPGGNACPFALARDTEFLSDRPLSAGTGIAGGCWENTWHLTAETSTAAKRRALSRRSARASQRAGRRTAGSRTRRGRRRRGCAVDRPRRSRRPCRLPHKRREGNPRLRGRGLQRARLRGRQGSTRQGSPTS